MGFTFPNTPRCNVPKYVTTPDAMRFWMDVQLALAEVEETGIRVDVDYLTAAERECTEKLRAAEAAVRDDPNYRAWQRLYGERANIGSSDQLAGLVFGSLGYTAKRKTESGDRDAADESAFEGIDLPIVKHYFTAAKLRKCRDTYLAGIRREMVRHPDGLYYVHPGFNLNTVSSFRSSGSDPNVQNQPVRNKMAAEMIRRCFVPRRGHCLVEIDYGQIEVRLAAQITGDQNLIDYVRDESRDMHRDMAMQIFQIPREAVHKSARQSAKNQFVFPAFYGSYYANCAPEIWGALDEWPIQLADGTPMREHLRRLGITELGDCSHGGDPRRGTFGHHLKTIEEDFWGNRFRGYAQWKKSWYDAYLRDGGFITPLGFATNIPLNRKQVCNFIIQGTSFHCLAWAMTVVVRRLRKMRMRSRVIAEIHDCMVLDVHPAERDAVIDLCHHVMTVEIHDAFKWLTVPLSAEAECCPIDRSWYDKVGMKRTAAGWVPADMAGWETKYGPWANQMGV